MYDTKITARQQFILEILETSNKGLTRSEIEEQLVQNRFAVSRITVIRDLNQLIETRILKTEGEGRATLYFMVHQSPVLHYIDLPTYFEEGVDERPVTTDKNFVVLANQLTNLLSDQEQKELDSLNAQYRVNVNKLNPAIYKKELDRFIIELSWKSSKIEGNTYSLLETEMLLNQAQEAQGHPREEARMILNHKVAFETIFAHKASFGVLKLSDILDIHQVLVQDLNIGQGLRKHPVGITGTRYKPVGSEWQIRECLEAIILVVNSTKNPLEKALIASATIAYIQPFADGNKRTSRLVANALLLAHNYAPLSYRSVNEMEYKQAVILFYEQYNLYHFKRLFIEQFKFSVETYFST